MADEPKRPDAEKPESAAEKQAQQPAPAPESVVAPQAKQPVRDVTVYDAGIKNMKDAVDKFKKLSETYSNPEQLERLILAKKEEQFKDVLKAWKNGTYQPTEEEEKALDAQKKTLWNERIATGVVMGVMAGLLLSAMPFALLGALTTTGLEIGAVAISAQAVSAAASLAGVALAAVSTWVGYDQGYKNGKKNADALKANKPTIETYFTEEMTKDLRKQVLMERAAEMADEFRNYLAEKRAIKDGMKLEEKEAVLFYVNTLRPSEKDEKSLVAMANGILADDRAEVRAEMEVQPNESERILREAQELARKEEASKIIDSYNPEAVRTREQKTHERALEVKQRRIDLLEQEKANQEAKVKELEAKLATADLQLERYREVALARLTGTKGQSGGTGNG